MLSLMTLLLPASGAAQVAQSNGAELMAVPLLFGLLLISLIALAALIFNVWMLIDAAVKPVDNKVLWIVLLVIGLVVGFGFIVALVYFFTDRKKFQRVGVSQPAQPWQPQQAPPSATSSTWPTTSPTANTEAPNPTDPPATPPAAADNHGASDDKAGPSH